MYTPIRNISSALAIFSLMIFSSCIKTDTEAIRKTDSLLTVIDSTEIKFMSFDTVRIQNAIESMEHKVELIKKYSSDSLDKETTMLLANYIHIYQALEKYPDDRKNIFPQIALSKKQLNNMGMDLNSNAMSPEEFRKHFPEEERAVAELSSYIRMTASKANLLLEQNEYIKSGVDSFIAKLDTLHEPEQKNRDLNEMFFEEE